jgi:hypothetical protein
LRKKTTALPKKGVLRGLLADGGATPQLSALRIAAHGIGNRIRIKAVMCAEFSILTRNHRARHVWINLFKAHPVAIDTMPLQRVADHGQRDRRWNEAVGQHPDQRADHKPEQRLTQPAEKGGAVPGESAGCGGHRADHCWRS